MSLLLEALKRAERAKEEAERRAGAESAEATGLRLEGEPPAPAAAGIEAPKSVLTRPELPDIQQPLEILTDDLAPKEAGRPRAPNATPPASQGEAARVDRSSDNRAAARVVFEAKFREPNPRMPFYITLSVLGVMALGTVGYFWYQLRPRPPLVNTDPPRTVSEPSGQITAVAPAVVLPASGAPRPRTEIPGLPQASAAGKQIGIAAASTPAAPTSAEPAPQPKTESSAPQARPAPARKPRAEPAIETRSFAPNISASRPAPRIHPNVQSAYEAYLKGDFAAARDDYQAVLREEPGNRDAHLGLASIDVRTGRLESAEARYLRLLQLDPTDSHAQAGLIALRSRRLDPLATESRVKNMLSADPEANVLHFTLGNQLAQQGRWAEAQLEYFKAFAAAPDNPDFAYNLAVSLDHLSKEKLALEYYRRAVTLAEGRIASFDVGAARTRAEQLGR